MIRFSFKKYFFVLSLIFTFCVSRAENINDNLNGVSDQCFDNDSVCGFNHMPYRIFPANNSLWTVIKLNTKNGQMWKVRYDTNNINKFVRELNNKSLVSKEEEVNGRFCLYRTPRSFMYILLDRVDGRLWYLEYDKEKLFALNESLLSVGSSHDIRFSIYQMPVVDEVMIIDGMDGKIWKVHLSEKQEKCVVRLIDK